MYETNLKQYFFDFKHFFSDHLKRKYNDLIAIDALKFRYPKQQFDESKIVRELKKCFCGFKSYANTEKLPAISTGNW